MRDHQRIDAVLAAVKEAWLAEPDLRLGQLLLNAVALRDGDTKRSLFHVEDDRLVKDLAATAKGARVTADTPSVTVVRHKDFPRVNLRWWFPWRGVAVSPQATQLFREHPEALEGHPLSDFVFNVFDRKKKDEDMDAWFQVGHYGWPTDERK